MLILALDVGNTRLKWGVHEGGRWLDLGALPLAEIDQLESRLSPSPIFAVFTNVAGAGIGAKVLALLGRLGIPHHEVVALAEQCGVFNTYENPAQLGADRWAALIGAKALHAGPALVVMAGTATTVDVLNRDGVFLGGLILPGFDLMRASLTHNTAQLKPEPGEFVDLPRATADAIASGCISAQLGAVERMFRQVASAPDALCILSGGAAHLLVDRLDLPKRLEPNLVLDGLARIARAD